MEIWWNIWICAEWEVGYTSTKLHFTNSWVRITAQAFVGLCERRIQNQHMVSRGFIFKHAAHGIRCTSAGGYQTVLHYCGRPLLDWGWISCIRRKASCTEPRSVLRRFDTNTCTMPPLIFMHIKNIWLHLYFWGAFARERGLIFGASTFKNPALNIY